jgi:hypothetical protein
VGGAVNPALLLGPIVLFGLPMVLFGPILVELVARGRSSNADLARGRRRLR